MSDAAAAHLATGFHRGDRTWWRATTAALAAALTVLVVVSAVFGGVEQEVEARVADFYTHDARVTPHGPAVIPAGTFNETRTAVLDEAAVVGHLESQFILSRRGLLEAAVFEEEGFDFEQPGTAGDARKDILLGVLVGVPFEQQEATERLERYRVSGQWPVHDPDEGVVPVVLSTDRLAALLTSQERDALSAWPPPVDELRSLRFEITAAVLEPDQDNRDVIRRPGRVAALYETGLENLDSITILAPIQSVRGLNGLDPDGDSANVLLWTGSPGDQATGWHVESTGDFTTRYVGQLIDVVRGLGIMMSAFLFLLPAVLVAHGITRQLHAMRRPLAIAHAIGVPQQTIRRAFTRLVARTTTLAAAWAALATAAAAWLLHQWLPRQTRTPLPMDVHVDAAMVAAALGVLLVTSAVATALALRTQRRVDMAGAIKGG